MTRLAVPWMDSRLRENDEGLAAASNRPVGVSVRNRHPRPPPPLACARAEREGGAQGGAQGKARSGIHAPLRTPGWIIRCAHQSALRASCLAFPRLREGGAQGKARSGIQAALRTPWMDYSLRARMTRGRKGYDRREAGEWPRGATTKRLGAPIRRQATYNGRWMYFSPQS